jgi:hypothetical protein
LGPPVTPKHRRSDQMSSAVTGGLTSTTQEL